MDIRELIPLAQRNGGQQGYTGLWYAKFANSPIAVGLDAYVIIPDIDLKIKWGPCRWMPGIFEQFETVSEAPEAFKEIKVGRIKLPVAGNECLIALDNRRQVWILAW